MVCFWSELKNFNEKYIFQNISKIALAILIIPHGNADVERAFSHMTNIKTKTRNRMSTQLFSSILRIKLDLKRNKNCCLTYDFNEKHFVKISKLYSENQGENTTQVERESDESSDSD